MATAHETTDAVQIWGVFGYSLKFKIVEKKWPTKFFAEKFWNIKKKLDQDYPKTAKVKKRENDEAKISKKTKKSVEKNLI